MRSFLMGMTRAGTMRMWLLSLFLIMFATMITNPAMAGTPGETIWLHGTIGASQVVKMYFDKAPLPSEFKLGKYVNFGVSFRSFDYRWKYTISADWMRNYGSATTAETYNAKGIVQYYPWWDKTKQWGLFVGFAGGHQWLDFTNDPEGAYSALMASSQIGVEKMLKENGSLELILDFGTSKTVSEASIYLRGSMPLRF